MNIALIPARSGSKRVPDKNIRILGGQPLIAWSIRTAKESKLIDKIVVSTDSEYYAAIVKPFGVDVLMRPKELATDDATDEDVIAYFMINYKCDYIVYLRPTTPCRATCLVDKAIKEFDQYSYSSLRSVEEMSESAFKCFEIHDNSLLSLSPMNGNLPNHKYTKTYKANGYVDILTNQFFGSTIQPFITPPVIEVDTEREFEMLQWKLEKKWTAEDILRNEG